jgi:hypothetical protein
VRHGSQFGPFLCGTISFRIAMHVYTLPNGLSFLRHHHFKYTNMQKTHLSQYTPLKLPHNEHKAETMFSFHEIIYTKDIHTTDYLKTLEIIVIIMSQTPITDSLLISKHGCTNNANYPTKKTRSYSIRFASINRWGGG